MIKDFKTYIIEGRMGRLVNADDNSVRKQDVLDKTLDKIIEGLKELKQQVFNNKKAESLTLDMFSDLLDTCGLMPRGNEWDFISKYIKPAKVEAVSNEPKELQYSVTYAEFDYSVCRIYCRGLFKYTDGVARNENIIIIEFSEDSNFAVINFFTPNTSPWGQRMIRLLKQSLLKEGKTCVIRLDLDEQE